MHLTAYDRAYILPRTPREKTNAPPLPPARRRMARGRQMLALVVLTRPRLGQPLLCAGLARAVWSQGRYRIIERELVPGADLQAADLDVLRSAGVRVFRDPREFARRRLIAGGYEAGLMIAGWDVPFVLSRFARHVRFGRDSASRHMTLDLTGYPWDPRARITAWDGTRSRIAWTRFKGSRGREEDDHDVFPGLFLDLQEHAGMYAQERLTFGEACALFDVAPSPSLAPSDTISEDTITGLFDALRATVALASALMMEWNRIGGAAARVPSRHPHETGARSAFPTEIASQATLLRAVLERAGVPLDANAGVPPEWLGRAMAAYKGGRCEAMLPGMIVPVRYVDILSAHPVVGSLVGASEHLTAQHVTVEPATDEARHLLSTVTLDALVDPMMWRRAGMILCRIRPRGDIIPVRAHYVERGDLTVGLNPTWSVPDQWVMLLDLTGSKIVSGRVPEIVEAVRFVPGSPRVGLRRVPFRGTVLDPHDDLFRQLVEERLRAKRAGETLWAQFLKIMENSLYGLFAQYNERARGRKRSAKTAEIWDGDGRRMVALFNRHTKQRIRPEEVPGPFFRPWLAASITAGTRLLLAILEANVRERGGTIAAADTDSAMIVASPEGGLIPCAGGPHRLPNRRRAIRALSFAEVDEILEWFRPLSPVRADVWKLEGENTPPQEARSGLLCLSYGPKRYALFHDLADGRIQIAKASAHALTVRPPRGMTKTELLASGWEALIRQGRGDRQAIRRLPYAQEIAVGELPLRNASVFRKVRDALPDETGPVFPFGTLMVAYQAVGLMTWGPRMSALPVAPSGSDPLDAPWIDLSSGCSVDVIATPKTDEQAEAALAVDGRARMVAAAYADVLRQHREGIEYKYVAYNGRPARPGCGLLRRRPIYIERTVAIGKESRLVEEAVAGAVSAEAMDTFYESAQDRPKSAEHEAALRELQTILPVLRPLPRRWLAKRARVSETSKILAAILNGRKRPGIALAQRLIEIAQTDVVRKLAPKIRLAPNTPMRSL